VKSLLAALLLLVVVIWLYAATIGGEGGAAENVRQNGERMGEALSRLDP
jgi:hypothetical protein